MVDGRKTFVNGKVEPWTGQVQEVFAPIYKPDSEEKVLIGYQARFDEEDSLKALDAAVNSWKNGRGEWAQSSPKHRIAKIEELVTELKPKRDEIINVLMWEICKTKADATKEFDRTMDFIRDTIKTYKAMISSDNAFVQDGGVLAQIKRAPIGVMLNLGPFNYVRAPAHAPRCVRARDLPERIRSPPLRYLQGREFTPRPLHRPLVSSPRSAGACCFLPRSRSMRRTAR